METIVLGQSQLRSSRLVYGCMRIAGDEIDKAGGKAALSAAVENGYTAFDHADIYGAGACESLFGEWLRESPGMRERLTLISKCGIRLDDPKRYDFSFEHIVASAESSLRRLGVDQLDVLLLHRPDYLMDFDEVARGFEQLQKSGKVAQFGVSNFLPERLRALQSALPMRMQVNQVEININNTAALENGVLDQAQAENLTVQAWSPLAGIALDAWRNQLSEEQVEAIRAEADRQAAHYGIERWQIALAWLLKHPASITPVVGSTRPDRIAAAPKALDIAYTRKDWYRLLEARNGPVP